MSEPTTPDTRKPATVLLAALVALLLGGSAIAVVITLANDVLT